MNPNGQRGQSIRRIIRALLLLLVSATMYASASAYAQLSVTPVTLEEAYRRALKTHPRVIIAQREVEKSRLLTGRANAYMLPQVSVSGGYNALDDPIVSSGIETVPQDQLYTGFEFSQPIFEAKFFPARRQALQAIDKTMENYSQVIQDVLFTVAQSYYEVLKAKELVENANVVLKLSEEILRVSQVRFKAGEVTEDYVIRSELSVTRAKGKLIEATNNLTLAKDNLKSLISWRGHNYDVIVPKPLTDEGETYETLIRTALKQRHDYRVGVATVSIAESDIDLAEADFYPRLTGAWNYNWVNNPAFDQEENYWVVGLKLTIPLYERGLRWINLKEKRENLRQAKLELRNTEDAIALEVEKAVLSVQTGNSILMNLTKQVELAQKNYDIIFSKFSAGSATNLEVEEALGSLASSRTELITRMHEYQMYLLNVQKASGLFASSYMPKEGEVFETPE